MKLEADGLRNHLRPANLVSRILAKKVVVPVTKLILQMKNQKQFVYARCKPKRNNKNKIDQQEQGPVVFQTALIIQSRQSMNTRCLQTST